jgi:hypothetical protein
MKHALLGILGTIFGVHESYGTPQVGSLVAYESDKELRLSVSGQYHRILTGSEWLTRIRGLGYGVSDEAAFVLGRDYIPYRGESKVLSVLRGKTIAEVMAIAKRGHYMEPHLAVACILREVLFDHWLRDYGLSALVIEHFPVQDPTGSLCKLALYRGEGGKQGWLDVYYGNPRGDVEPGVGFVFLLP